MQYTYLRDRGLVRVEFGDLPLRLPHDAEVYATNFANRDLWLDEQETWEKLECSPGEWHLYLERGLAGAREFGNTVLELFLSQELAIFERWLVREKSIVVYPESLEWQA